jgi:hypothetical protein
VINQDNLHLEDI